MSQLTTPPRQLFFGAGYPDFVGLKVIPVRTIVLGNGQNDIYTVPANKRASFAYSISNQSGGAITHSFQIKVAGIYYTFIVAASQANNSTSLISNPMNTAPIAEAGETLSILTTGAGLVLSGYLIEFSSQYQLKSPKLLSLVNGNNTVYTCPSGKKAFIGNSVTGNAGIVKYFNGTGSNRAIHWNVVKSGGSPSAAVNQTSANVTAIATATINNIQNMYASLTAGDFISINSDSSLATQQAWIQNLVELPA